MLFRNSEKSFEDATINALQVYNLISQHIQVKNCRLNLDKYFNYSKDKGHSIENWTQCGGLTLAKS